MIIQMSCSELFHIVFLKNCTIIMLEKLVEMSNNFNAENSDVIRKENLWIKTLLEKLLFMIEEQLKVWMYVGKQWNTLP